MCVGRGGRGSLKRQTPAPDVRPKESLVIGIGRDTGAQEETADANPPPHLPAWSRASSALSERTMTLMRLVGGRGQPEGGAGPRASDRLSAPHRGAATTGNLEAPRAPQPQLSLGAPQALPGPLRFPTGASGLLSQGPPHAALMAQPGAPGTSPPPRPLCQPPGPLTAETQSSAAAWLSRAADRPARLAGRAQPSTEPGGASACSRTRPPGPRGPPNPTQPGQCLPTSWACILSSTSLSALHLQ